MKNAVLLFVTLMLCLAVTSSATDTRVLTMGDNNNILHDEANVWLYPSRINKYPDLAVVEIGNPERDDFIDPALGPFDPMERFGVNFKFGSDNPWVLGLYLHNNAPFFDQHITDLLPFTPIEVNPYPLFDEYFGNKRMDLFYGRALGSADFGFHFGMVHSSYKDEFPAEFTASERSFSNYVFDAGMSFDNGTLDVAAGLDIFGLSDKDTWQTGTDPDVFEMFDDTKSSGNTIMYLRARKFWEYNPTYTFVPHAEITSGSFEADDYDWDGDSNELDETEKFSLTSFEFGSGIHYTPATNVLAVVDCGLRYQSVKFELEDETGTTENKIKVWSMPYFKVGFEADVFRWMDVRFGATSFWNSQTDEDTNGIEFNEKFPVNKTYLGFGFHWNRLQVDAYTDPELFLNGFDFISGNGSGDMNFQISAVYEMI